MKRIYETVVNQHIQHWKQMLFLAGPRQVGKTTISLAGQYLTDRFIYLNWDNIDHRQLILKGPTHIAEEIGLSTLKSTMPILVLDEFHKFKSWKNFLKGFFDTYQNQLRIIITGSSRLDIYRKGGDSLMGRYFPYRVHPFSIAECIRTTINKETISPPKMLATDLFFTLFEYGGFPEPFINKQAAFSRRWKQLRSEQLFRGDIRDLSRIQELNQLEVLAELLKQQAGQLTNYSSLANKVRVSADTVRRWINTLASFYYCFIVKPWTKNISRSLLKEPKIYLWDWSDVSDQGQRAENFIASHLLKATNFWTDQGLGSYELFFIRDKDKKEVDFLVTENNKPWFIVEVKYSNHGSLSRSLDIFQHQTKAKHAFQVIIDMDYVDVDCFSYQKPIIVPAQTFLSQLI